MERGLLALCLLSTACADDYRLEVDSAPEDPCAAPRYYPGDLVISGQHSNDTLPHALAYAQMGEFCAEYSGLRGDLVVAYSDVRDLDPLSCLCAVEGSVELYVNEELASVAGLAGLRDIGGDLHIAGNPALSSLAGLEGVSEVPGELGVYSNWALQDLRGLAGLRQVGEGLFLSDNGLLELRGLEQLERVEGYLYVGYHAWLYDLRGLSGLREVGGDLTLRYNERLYDLRGADRLDSVGALAIYGNPRFDAVEGLGALRFIHGDALIEDNARVAHLTDLRALERVDGDLRILNNSSLSRAEVERLLDSLGDDTVGGEITCEWEW
ncbi:MAG: hypothetical protein H6741_16480 [Alphaproteobacteria bacterium]|nr:hypothetical protein [Alphaproteobacteria bacterium]MCB9794312.1 hypothetical protein [Alphaproteobacteria bacterium]